MRIGVVVFPGSNCDHDALHVSGAVAGQTAVPLWHDSTDLAGCDAIVIPGGFSYGDYLRCGAIARFSPILQAVKGFAERGGPVLGICNGFQILCEAGMLPGALLRNAGLKFACRQVTIRVESNETPFTGSLELGAVLRVPVAHGEGNYFAEPAVLKSLEQRRQVVFRYTTQAGVATPGSNPNGSAHNIAGICNQRRNVVGLMPHPERASEPQMGSADGLRIFESLIETLSGSPRQSTSRPTVCQ